MHSMSEFSTLINGKFIKKYSTLPTASVTYVGQIVQYVGVTTSTLKHGFFYECILESGVYSWEESPVGEGGAGHEIVNASGTSMAQEDKLQFATMQVTDDPTNGKTIVRHVVQLTQVQYDALPASKLTDNIIYEISDENRLVLNGKDLYIVVDNALSSTSENPVQNKVVYSALSDKENKHTVLSQTLSAGSTTVTFTSIPTSGNYIIEFATSAGINYTAIDTSTSGQVTLTFEAQSAAVTVYCDIKEVS